MNIQEMGDQIKVTIPKNREDTIPLTFTVNGESVTVPRGEEVTIPAMFAGAIKNWWKAQFYEKGEDDASLKGEGGLTPFFLNMDTFEKENAEAGEAVVNAILSGRTVYLQSDDTDSGVDMISLFPVIEVDLGRMGGDSVSLTYIRYGEQGFFTFKIPQTVYGDGEEYMNPYIKEFNV